MESYHEFITHVKSCYDFNYPEEFLREFYDFNFCYLAYCFEIGNYFDVTSLESMLRVQYQRFIKK